MSQQHKYLPTFIWMFIIVTIGMAYGAVPVFAADADLIISEVMHDPNGTPLAEWVEIYNKGAAAIDLNGWQICDKGACDTIATVSTIINPGEYFLIGVDVVNLTNELTSYTPADAYNPMLTTFVSNPGDGIGNTLGGTDMVFLVSPSVLVSDCVSWDDPLVTSCSPTPGGSSPRAGTAYAAGADGADSAPNGSATGPGQSIVNIGGTWFVAPLDDPSPYGINTADAGPTAVHLNNATANSSLPLAAVGLFGMFLLAVSGLTLLRRKATV